VPEFPVPAAQHTSGHLPDNLVGFLRLIRRAGLRIGPGQGLVAAEALNYLNLQNKREIRDGLAASLAIRHPDRPLFNEAFSLYWRDPEAVRAAAALAALEGPGSLQKPEARPGARRIAEAFQGDRPQRPPDQPPGEETTIDAVLTANDTERLSSMDFEAMGEDDIRSAKRLVARMRLPVAPRPIRRFRPDPGGHAADLRATVRGALRQGGDVIEIARKTRRTRLPPLVALCDISGSMARYAQVLLHFLHTATNAPTMRQGARLHTFLFGTRLTNVTRALRHRDPEAAFELVSKAVPDWSGGTRIGESLHRFNHDWARRVLGQNAVVLLITDGLDRDGAAGLTESMDRLHRSCARLIWLNPLLRYQGFAPRSQGIRAMLPHVDEFRPVHNLASLAELVSALSEPAGPRGAAASRFQKELRA